MADKIQLTLEGMIPELDALVNKEIFTKLQVKSIIKKRRNYEYGMAKKNVSLEDYKKAIRYELILSRRKEKMKKQKNVKQLDYVDFHCKSLLY